MHGPDHSGLRRLTLKMLAQRTAAASGADALATAARSAYDDLARISAPLIGVSGMQALAGRAIHLAQREHPCLASLGTDPPIEPLAQVVACLQREDPAVAGKAADAVFVALVRLLVTFIGEPLTTGLLRQAWPDVFVYVTAEESRA